MLYCRCGYTCGTQSALDKHVKRFEGTDAEGQHMLDTKGPLSLPSLGRKGSKSAISVGITGPSLSLTEDLERSRGLGDDSMGRTQSLPSNASPLGSTLSFPESPVTPLTPSDLQRSRSILARAGSSTLLGGNSPAAKGARVRLLVVRHAQSANKQRLPGQKASADPELTDLGYDQAEALGKRLARDFPPEALARMPLAVVSSPMRRCLLTIQPAVKRLRLGKDVCMCHGSFFEFGCAGTERRTSTPEDIVYDFPEFSPIGFNAQGRWDYRGESPKETEQECKERCARMAEWLHSEAATSLRARSSDNEQPTLILVIHQSVADLLCQILVEGTSANWTYGDIQHRIANAAITEVFLFPDGKAAFGRKNDDSHNFEKESTSRWKSRRNTTFF